MWCSSTVHYFLAIRRRGHSLNVEWRKTDKKRVYKILKYENCIDNAVVGWEKRDDPLRGPLGNFQALFTILSGMSSITWWASQIKLYSWNIFILLYIIIQWRWIFLKRKFLPRWIGIWKNGSHISLLTLYINDN